MQQTIGRISAAKTQKYLGEKGLIAFIVLLSAIIPLSIDIYLPALPRMSETFNDTRGLINYTLIGFFIFFGISTLIWGPISDKFGRKPILQTGLFIYVAGSILCVFATNVYSLIFYRILQAIGSGAIVAVAGAVVKDSFEGKKRESVMALVQSMAMIAPLIAPIIGAFILKVTSWQGVFVVLSLFGIFSFIGASLFQESIDEKHDGNLASSLGRLVHVAKNPRFSSLMLVFLLSQIANMAYVSSSAYIYVKDFHLSEQTYSLFFAANACFLIMGPLFYIKLSTFMNSNKIIITGFVFMLISGIFVCTLGQISPWFFAAALIPSSFFGGVVRPLGANLMFNQQKGDAGSASSLMGFGGTVFGSLGMFIASLNLVNNITLIGLITVITSTLSLILWFAISKKIVTQP